MGRDRKTAWQKTMGNQNKIRRGGAEKASGQFLVS